MRPRYGVVRKKATVVPVPPLHERVLDARVDRIAADPGVGDRQVVADVEHRDRDDARDVEPDRDVEVLLAPDRDRAEEVHRVDDPEDRERHVERPRQLGVLPGLREAEEVADPAGGDQRLPPPEVDPGEGVAVEPGLEQPLHRVVAAREDHVPHEGEDHRVGVQRPQPPEGEPGRHVESRQEEQRRDQEPNEHADHGPEDGGQEEEARGVVIEAHDVVHRSSILCRCVFGAVHTAAPGGADRYG